MRVKLVSMEKQCTSLSTEMDKLRQEKASTQRLVMFHKEEFRRKEQDLKKMERELQSIHADRVQAQKALSTIQSNNKERQVRNQRTAMATKRHLPLDPSSRPTHTHTLRPLRPDPENVATK